MKKIVFGVVLLTGFCYGQTLTSGGFNDIAGNDRSWQDMQIGTVFKEVPIEGTPYMEELYKMGIASVNGKEINLLMRYDAFNDQIELIDSRQKSFNLLKKENIEAEIEGKTYEVISYEKNGKRELGYVNPLTEGEVVLYFKPRKIFVQAEKPEHGYDDYRPPQYVENHTYFIARKGSRPEEIRLAKGPLLRYLRDKAPQLRDYISAQDLDLKTAADAVKLVDHYNRLDPSS